MSVLIALNFRPGIIGEFNNKILIFLSFLIFVSYLLLFNKDSFLFNKKILIQFILILFFIVFILIQLFYLQPSNFLNPIKNVILILIFSFIYIFFASDSFYTDIALKVLVKFVIILSISEIITFILIFFVSKENLILFSSIRTHQSWIRPEYADLFFPFTIAGSNSYNLFGIELERAMGLFREPGIYQMYINLAFFSLDFINMKYKAFIRILLVVALFFTFSTAGFGIFLICLVFRTFFILEKNSKLKKTVTIFISILFIVLLTYFILFSSRYGAVPKLNSTSGQARLSSVIESFKYIVESPFLGTGYGNPGKDASVVVFLAGFHTIGIIGLLLYLTNWFYSIMFLSKFNTIILYIPIFLTLLFAQPIFDNLIVFFFLLIDTRKLNIK